MNLEHIIALLTAFGAGTILRELIRRVVPSRKEEGDHELQQARLIDEEAARIRKELREDVEYLRKRMREVEQELHDTRNALTILQFKHAELQIQYTDLQAEVTRAKEKS
jgi:chromosome segregation ATPase